MGVFLFFAVSAILLLLLLDTVEIEYIYNGEMTYVFSYSVFELTLFGKRKKNGKKKKSILQRLRTLPYIKRSIDYSLSHSDVTVNRLYTSGGASTFFKNSVASHGVYSAAFAFALSYIEAKAQNVSRGGEIDLEVLNTDGRSFDISITQKIRLFHLLSGIFISITGRVRKLIKDGVKIGRQQNE